MSMKNLELFNNPPDAERILNQGVAEVSERHDEEYERVLRYELETFICEGQYQKGLDKVFAHYLNALASNAAEQRGVWISGFYGSGKTHLAKMLRVLWTDYRFRDGSTARGIVRLPDDIKDHLKELAGAADRNGAGLFAASGKMGGGGTASVHLAVLGIICRAAGYPSQYAQTKFVLWLKDEKVLEAVQAHLATVGKDLFAELDNLYVSPAIAGAIRKALPGTYKDDGEVRQALKANFMQPADISDDDLVKTIEHMLTKDGKFPLTLLVLDELQQYIGNDSDKAYKVHLVAEACTKRFSSRLLMVGTGQSALSDTPNLSRLLARFQEKVQLTENDVDRVIRKIILSKKPTVEAFLKGELEKRHGEIARHLEGSAFAHSGKSDGELVSDYPLLPSRRRFWEHILRTIDPTGTTAQVRNQLRVVNEAVVSVGHQPVGTIVGGDFVFDQNAESLVASQAIDRETYTRILELSGATDPQEVLMGRILKLVFLINKLPTEGASDTKLRATPTAIADLLVENLDADSTELRRSIPTLLEVLVQRHALMEISGERGTEYRLQTRESAEWYDEFRSQEAALRGSASTVTIKRNNQLRERLERETRALSYIHGESKESRKPELRFDFSIPSDYRKNLYIWVRDGSTVTESIALGEARALENTAPVTVVYLPDEQSNELFNAIIAAEAAQATINARGLPSTPAGLEARKSIESRLSGARASIERCLDSVVDGVRVWMAGGSEVANGIGLRELLERALEKAVGRLYPRFAEADSKAWEKVITEAKKGNRDALAALGYSGDPAEHTVCKTVLDTIGSEKTGKFVRDTLSEAPYGWSKDAIDGALLVLLASERLLASDASNHTLLYSAQTIDRSKIGLCRFKREDRPLSPNDRIQLRGLYQLVGVACKSGEELAGSNAYLSALRNLASKAGGEPPLPAVPSSPLLLELEGLLGNERLFRIIEELEKLKEYQQAWSAIALAIEQRRARWLLLQGLLEKGCDSETLSSVKGECDAILANRSLASPVDPVEPLLYRVATELRQSINELAKTYQDEYTHHHAVLESDSEWQRLSPDHRTVLMAGSTMQALSTPDLSTPDAVLARLSERPLDAWAALIDALPGRFQSVRKSAMKLLEPDAVPLSLPRRVIKTEAELENWLDEVRTLAKRKMETDKVPILL